MGVYLDIVINAINDLEDALIHLVENGDEDVLTTQPYDDLLSVLSGFYGNSDMNDWWECNKDGDILQEAYQNYMLDSAGIPDDEMLTYKEWAKAYYHELMKIK